MIKINNFQTSLVLALMALSLGGCGSKLSSIPIDSTNQAALHRGIVYYLPKTILSVAVSFSVYQRQNNSYYTLVKGEPDKNVNNLDGGYDRAVTIKTVSMPDPDLAFCIDTEKLSSPTVRTGGADPLPDLSNSKSDTAVTPLTISLNDDGTLKGIRASFEDRSAAILDNLANGAISVAQDAIKFGAMGATTPVAPPDKSARYLGTITLSRRIDPSRLTSNTVNFSDAGVKCCLVNFINSMGKTPIDVTAGAAVLPNVYLTIDAWPSIARRITSRMLLRTPQEKYINGVVVRVPATIPIAVAANYGTSNESLADCPVSLCQAGELVTIPMTSSVFSTRQHHLSFDANTSTVTVFAQSSTSSLNEFTTELKQIGVNLEKMTSNLFPTIKLNAASISAASAADTPAIKNLAPKVADKPASAGDKAAATNLP